ncbi:hypothetical protein [Jannaschia sp. CCS1]|uniref:hypothetical protein n=1 Tax=Jannaschia sp. (strain CCS1) TaxID=290400 RepID=UPI000053C3D0|nr:hypothetical protein [Jannaschia sp. CCS1]ABD53315.1 hypothetical protein Jann_0398 [Jannaschia sp. CCS1]
MQQALGAGRVFASHYQFVLCEDPDRVLADAENWTDDTIQLGFAGVPKWRMIGTEANLNDHWIELSLDDQAPEPEHWQRIICCGFETATGAVHVMGLMDADPAISAKIAPGAYAAYICGRNLGVDAEGSELPTDAELAARDDVERYRIILVPGAPSEVGVLYDRGGDAGSAP